MGLKTGVIRFNVKDRGRVFRGQNRNFDTHALADLVNGGSVQERVKNGDMVGFYGHWPRVKFGLAVQEAGIVNGKVINLEPAVRTTYIKAYPDGTIEHEQEFLDTASGRLAQRVFQSNGGGFSSAIHAPRIGSMQVPQDFHGFDYVLEPNYTTNRGYVLDAAGNPVDMNAADLSDEEAALLDDVSQYNAMIESTTAVLDRVQQDYDRAAESLMALHEENVELQSALARKEREVAELKQQVLDAVAAIPRPEPSKADILDSVKGIVKPVEQSRFANADDFFGMKLEDYDAPNPRENEPKTAADKYIERRFGLPR